MKTIQNKLLSAVILLILATINCTAQNRFPDGETRYYATADKSIIFNLQFYYDKGDRCAIYKNNAWRGGIKLKDFGMKNGKADYGQFKDMPRIGANYTVYYERIRNYLHSWLESMLVSPDFSHITIKGAYNYSASFSRISKAEYDRLYSKFTKGNSGGSYSSRQKHICCTSTRHEEAVGKNRESRMLCVQGNTPMRHLRRHRRHGRLTQLPQGKGGDALQHMQWHRNLPELPRQRIHDTSSIRLSAPRHLPDLLSGIL